MDDEIYDRIIFLADPELSEPVLVICLEGCIDAGLGATDLLGQPRVAAARVDIGAYELDRLFDDGFD